jgi:hypothetical protein
MSQLALCNSGSTFATNIKFKFVLSKAITPHRISFRIRIMTEKVAFIFAGSITVRPAILTSQVSSQSLP